MGIQTHPSQLYQLTTSIMYIFMPEYIVVNNSPIYYITSHQPWTLNEREAVTNGEATTSLNAVHCAYRHPEYPAVGTLEARLQGHVVK